MHEAKRGQERRRHIHSARFKNECLQTGTYNNHLQVLREQQKIKIDNFNQAAKQLVRKCKGIKGRSKKNGSMQELDKKYVDIKKER